MVFTPKSLAERWECSAGTIYNMIERGELAAFKVGGKLLRIREDVVEAYERQNDILQGEDDSSALQGGKNAATEPQPSAQKRAPASKLTAEQRVSLKRLRDSWK